MIGALLAKLRAAADRDLPQHLCDARRGEDLAYDHLRARGYKIVARNYRSRSGRGEIDLLGWDGEHLACIEVKARRSADFGRPEQRVGREKRRLLVHAANDYARRAGVDPDRLRFDVVSIVFSDPPEIELYQAAFTARDLERRGG